MSSAKKKKVPTMTKTPAKSKGSPMQRGKRIADLVVADTAAAEKKAAAKKASGRKSVTRKVATPPARVALKQGRPSTLRGGYARLAEVMQGSDKLAAAVGVTLRSIQRYSAQEVKVPAPVMLFLKELARKHGVSESSFSVDVDTACRELGDRLAGEPWFSGVNAVTKGTPHLVLSIRTLAKDARKLKRTGWLGFSVVVRRAGSLK